MEPLTRNGGFIGVTLEFDTTDRYPEGSEPATIEYVGGKTQTFIGSTTNDTVSLTNLTGGLAAAPSDGDIIIAAVELCGTTNKSYRIAADADSVYPYTQIADLYVSDTEDSNLQVGYKIAGSPGSDAFLVIDGGSGSVLDSVAVAIHVYRNVSTSNPLDVTPTTSSTTNSFLPNPPAITPVTSGALILVAGGAAHTRGSAAVFSAPYLTNFQTVSGNDDNDALIGLGSYAWTSGSYDPAAWTVNQTTSALYSANAVTIALRPGTIGNLKNSGIWDIQAAYDSLAPAAGSLDTQTVTVGVSLSQYVNTYGYSSGSSLGSISDGTSNLYGGATITNLYNLNSSNTLFSVAGNHANSGWTTMTIGTTDFLREDASYNYSSESNVTSWNWSPSANPFGTTEGATVDVVWS